MAHETNLDLEPSVLERIEKDADSRGIIGELVWASVVPMGIWVCTQVVLSGSAAVDARTGVHYISVWGYGPHRVVEPWYWWTVWIAQYTAAASFVIAFAGCCLMKILDNLEVNWYTQKEQAAYGPLAALVTIPLVFIFVVLGVFIITNLDAHISVAAYDPQTGLLSPWPP